MPREDERLHRGLCERDPSHDFERVWCSRSTTAPGSFGLHGFNWRSASAGASIVELEHAAEAFSGPNVALGGADRFRRCDELVADVLVMSLAVEMGDVFAKRDSRYQENQAR